MPCPIKLNNLLLIVSKTATLGTEGDRCGEVETKVNVWKLQGEWVQALVALIYGINDARQPKRSQKSLRRRFLPILLIVSAY